jgi:quercetin dioxygenase-like cupin family protein
MTGKADEVQVITLDANCPELPLVEAGGRAVALVWPGTGATLRSMHHFALEAGGRTVQQRHPGEAVYFVKSGSGSVTDPEAGTDPLVTGSMILVEPGTAYVFTAGEEGMELLGGPAPHDPALYAHLTKAA